MGGGGGGGGGGAAFSRDCFPLVNMGYLVVYCIIGNIFSTKAFYSRHSGL